MKKIIFISLVAVTITAQAQPIYIDRIGFKLESIADIDSEVVSKVVEMES